MALRCVATVRYVPGSHLGGFDCKLQFPSPAQITLHVLTAHPHLQDSIKASQQWFMACGPSAVPGLARMMAVRCVASSTDTEKRLHIIYLTNDILFRGCAAGA